MLGELPPRLPLVKPHILVLAGLTLAVVGAEIRYVKTDEQDAQVLLRLVPTAILVAGGGPTGLVTCSTVYTGVVCIAATVGVAPGKIVLNRGAQCNASGFT